MANKELLQLMKNSNMVKPKKYILKLMEISTQLEKREILQDLDFLKKIIVFLG